MGAPSILKVIVGGISGGAGSLTGWLAGLRVFFGGLRVLFAARFVVRLATGFFAFRALALLLLFFFFAILISSLLAPCQRIWRCVASDISGAVPSTENWWSGAIDWTTPPRRLSPTPRPRCKSVAAGKCLTSLLRGAIKSL